MVLRYPRTWKIFILSLFLLCVAINVYLKHTLVDQHLRSTALWERRGGIVLIHSGGELESLQEGKNKNGQNKDILLATRSIHNKDTKLKFRKDEDTGELLDDGVYVIPVYDNDTEEYSPDDVDERGDESRHRFNDKEEDLYLDILNDKAKVVVDDNEEIGDNSEALEEDQHPYNNEGNNYRDENFVDNTDDVNKDIKSENSESKYFEQRAPADILIEKEDKDSDVTISNHRKFDEMSRKRSDAIDKAFIDTQSSNAEQDKGVRKLIILTYMRSGSSFTGKLVALSPEVFYVYEPLYSLQKTYSGENGAKFFKKPSVKQTKREDFYKPSSLAVDIVKSFLDCSPEDVDLRTLKQGHMLSSHSTRHFGLQINLAESNEQVQNSLDEYRSKCLKASVTAAKVIRMTMLQAKKLVATDPQVRILHLIRDPRGMLHSQGRLRFQWHKLKTESQTFCGRIYQDLMEHADMAKTFPDRSLLVRYEDLVQAPEEAIFQIYSFINLNVPKTILSKALALASDRDRPFTWRQQISFRDVATIEKACMNVTQIMAYRPIPSQNFLRNKTFSLVESTFGTFLPMQKLTVKTHE